MESSFHYLLMANQARFQKKFFSLLADTPLTQGQPKVLDYLREHDGAAQKEIAAACQIEPASRTSILNGMDQKGLIQRRMQNGDRRSFHIFMTPEGRRLSEIIRERFLWLEERTLRGISLQERQQFLATFEKIFENLNHEEGSL